MRAIELDFLRNTRRQARAGWLLLAIGVAFAGDVAISYVKARGQVVEREERLAQLLRPAQRAEPLPTLARPATKEEIAFARESIQRLALPWNALFHALEASTTSGVALLAIEPDAAARSVRISGESRDYAAALDYVAALGREGKLSGVHLAKHETRPEDPRRIVSFAVRASWKEGAP